MKIAIRYYSKSGHTKKLADAISDVVKEPSLDISEPINEDVDILFLGSSIYGNSIDPALVKFFSTNNVNIGCIVSFSTAGVMESTYNDIKNLADSYGISISSKEFHCPGEFAGINAGRPNDNDIKNIKSFIEEFLV